jgi:hypothetical protein
VSAVCPNGHESGTTDYCDQCGALIGAPAGGSVALAGGSAASSPAAPGGAVRPAVEEVDTSAAALAEPCHWCGAPRSGDDRYCEGCGHDFGALPAAPAWEAVAAADREQFERVAPDGLAFPERYAERRFPLDGAALRIGRSRGRPGETVPEIDLAGEPEDPGVSRLHAVLERQDDGSYALRDLGSTNGTTLNEDPKPVGSETAVPLAEGDRIHLGAWTILTLTRR